LHFFWQQRFYWSRYRSKKPLRTFSGNSVFIGRVAEAKNRYALFLATL